MTNSHFEPGFPALYFENYLRSCGHNVVSTISFTGLSTIVLVKSDQARNPNIGEFIVVKGFFGYYMAQRIAEESIRSTMYGYYWYKEFNQVTYDYWSNQFRQEAIVLQQLRGEPNWTSVYRAELEGEIPFYEMEYLPDGNFAHYLQSHGNEYRQLLVADTISIGLQLFNGLKALHHLNFVHRDITPENILMRNGTPIYCDLGCARDVTKNNESAVRKEPLFYWSPDYTDNYHLADERDDIYSVGCILYQSITGTLPRFEAPPIRAMNACISTDLESFILKCIAYDKTERFSSVQQCLTELKAISDHNSD